MGAVLWTLGLLAVSIVVITFESHVRSGLMVLHAHVHLTSLLAIACMIAGIVVLRRAVSPFNVLRDRLADVRKGAERQLSGAYPSEIQPLVDDLNALLRHSDAVVKRAIAKAGDLAHGLKTPLAILANEADRMARTQDSELADTIAQQVAIMQRQVDYHLAHARAAASGTATGARASIRDAVEGLVRAVQRVHRERCLTIDIDVPSQHRFRGQREDLEEMLGNLLDNACKWARSHVVINSSVNGGRVVVTLDDDGAGLVESMRKSVLDRGVRADEAAPGSGLGLAIVRDIAEIYGGSVTLDASPLKGLRAVLDLPRVEE